MPNRSTDELFQLVKALEKAEKRNFKLYANRSAGSDGLKTVQLFDALDKMENYDEALLLKKTKGLKKQQLSNLKAALYKQILASLRFLKDPSNIDMQLHEQMDHAKILYNKGLYLQSLKILDRLKELAKKNSQFTYLLQAHFFEKKIEGLHITRSMQDRAESLSMEAREVSHRLTTISELSNLSLQLYSWYIRNGHARNQADIQAVRKYFDDHLPADLKKVTDFYEKLYLFQSYCWYAFIRQDFLMYYRYAQKWVDLFEQSPSMKDIETAHYIKGVHNLLGAHFDLGNYEKMKSALRDFEAFSRSRTVTQNKNNTIQVFVYLSLSKINMHFLEGTFSQGLKLVPDIIDNLDRHRIYLDRHRILVFYYKIACLYFGSGDNETAIDYLNKIINLRVDLRTDLQCYARLLHLIAHYELGNFELIEYLIKSVYRFMAKMENLSHVEEEIFTFLRSSFHISQKDIRPAFEELYHKLKKYEKNKMENRAFMYLDIISWLESKIYGGQVQKIIHQKFMAKKKKTR